MEEIQDEFYCGTNEEINEFDSPIVITKRKLDADYGTDEYLIAKAQEKLERVNDVEFVRIWGSSNSIFEILEELQDRIGCVFTGTEMLRCIVARANYLRKHGVRVQAFTI